MRVKTNFMGLAMAFGVFAMVAHAATEAHWTGAANDGDVANVANWQEGVLPDVGTTVYFTGNLPNITSGASFAAAAVNVQVPLSGDLDWRGVTAPFAGTISLNGHELRLSTLEGTGTFTDNVTVGGALVVDVPEGMTLTYSGGMKLGGTLKLVKTGAGTLVGSSAGAAKNQTFTGGTEILGGTVNASGWGSDHRWGAAGGTITVGTNGVFEMQGMPYFADYTFVLNGGKIANGTAVDSRWATAWQLNAIKTVRVDSDSTLDFSQPYSVMSYNNSKHDPTYIDLQGHTLTADFRVAMCYFGNTTATRGTIRLNGRTQFYGGDFNGPETTLDVYGYLVAESNIYVGTYICRTAEDLSFNNSKDVFVHERFTPITDYFYGCILKDGAKLDLSMRTGAWNVRGACTKIAKNTVRFEDNATITIDVGDRTLAKGEWLVAWDETAEPANLSTLTFNLIGTNVQDNVELLLKDDGIYYGEDSALPVVATWTGAARDGDYANPLNWECRDEFDAVLTNAIPSPSRTAVSISGSTDFPYPKDATPIWKSIRFNGPINLTTNCDWRGVAASFNGTITLNGHELWLSTLEGTGTFTDSANAGGVLVVDVPEGVTLTYSGGMKLGGTLKLVKEGAGTLTGSSAGAAKNQTFTGGTEILGGTVNASGWGSDHRWGAAGGTITVGTNGVFELQGMPYFADYTFVLNGGKIANGTAVNSSWGTAWQLNAIKTVRVDSDSTLDFSQPFSVMTYNNSKYETTYIDLQGHTLTADYKANYCYFGNTTVTRGTIRLNGRTQFIGGDFNGRETTFDVYGWFSPEVDVHIGTYICRTTSASPWTSKDVYVYERFQPVTDMFWGCVLKNGAMLDLSEREGVFNVKGTMGGSTTKTVITFEDNAIIKVDLGTRYLDKFEPQQVVSWTDETRPTNLSTLTFKVDAAHAAKYFTLVKKDDGLWLLRQSTVIFVR